MRAVFPRCECNACAYPASLPTDSREVTLRRATRATRVLAPTTMILILSLEDRTEECAWVGGLVRLSVCACATRKRLRTCKGQGGHSVSCAGTHRRPTSDAFSPPTPNKLPSGPVRLMTAVRVGPVPGALQAAPSRSCWSLWSTCAVGYGELRPWRRRRFAAPAWWPPPWPVGLRPAAFLRISGTARPQHLAWRARTTPGR